MKKLFLLFVVFLVLLGAVAHFTRPGDPKKSIAELIKKNIKTDSNVPGVSMGVDAAVDNLTKDLTVRDHFFWVTVRKGDKVICRGAFTQWFSTDELAMLKIASQVNDVKEKMQGEVNKVQDQVKQLDPNVKLPDVKLPPVNVPGVP